MYDESLVGKILVCKFNKKVTTNIIMGIKESVRYNRIIFNDGEYIDLFSSDFSRLVQEKQITWSKQGTYIKIIDNTDLAKELYL